MTSRLLLLAMDRPAIRLALQAAYPGATLIESDETNLRHLTGPVDVAILQATTNAGLARVRLLRKLHPGTCIIVLGDRDRSADAYMAGANEYVQGHDIDRLLHILAEIMGPGQAVAAPAATEPWGNAPDKA